jgi:hypothetical protein
MRPPGKYKIYQYSIGKSPSITKFWRLSLKTREGRLFSSPSRENQGAPTRAARKGATPRNLVSVSQKIIIGDQFSRGKRPAKSRPRKRSQVKRASAKGWPGKAALRVAGRGVGGLLAPGRQAIEDSGRVFNDRFFRKK